MPAITPAGGSSTLDACRLKAALRERLARAALLAAVAVLAGCSTLRSNYVKSPSTALPQHFDTPSARYVRAELDRHAGQSGFRLLASSTDALMSRIALIDRARHSIDMQYFIFEDDATGRLVAQRLLAAADRGVRVRLLLDDVKLRHEDRLLGALDAHPLVQVRVFNPFRMGNPSIASKFVELIFDGRRLNRRMHNKSVVVDNFAAVIGGRNIGDSYFDAGSDNNFRDLDVIAVGPVVAEASNAFDEYWNSDAAYPLGAFRTARNSRSDLSHVRPVLTREVRDFAQSDHARAATEELPEGATADRPGRWLWGSASLVADQPEKIDADLDPPAPRIGPKLKRVIESARSELLLISPYFVPGEEATRLLTELARSGVAVKVLTNSLASTDESPAHSGYARYRRALMTGGVQLYELRPRPGATQRPAAGGAWSGISLHAKAIVVDRRLVIVGSMNIDPRSRLLNTETSVFVDCPALAQAVARFFEQAAGPDSAFHVELQKPAEQSSEAPRLIWSWEDHGVARTDHRDPGASALRSLEVGLLRLLPIQGLL